MSGAGTLDRKIARALGKPRTDPTQHGEFLANRILCPHPLRGAGEHNHLPDALEMLIHEQPCHHTPTNPPTLPAEGVPKVRQ
jgi:hypothetical protein